jgi:hypothetical protein
LDGCLFVFEDRLFVLEAGLLVLESSLFVLEGSLFALVGGLIGLEGGVFVRFRPVTGPMWPLIAQVLPPSVVFVQIFANRLE